MISISHDVEIAVNGKSTNCNKFYCNLTFYKFNTYLILASACFGLVEQNVSTNESFNKDFSCREVTPLSAKTPKNLNAHQDVDTPYLIGIATSFVSRAGRKVGVATFVLNLRKKTASYLAVL